MSEASGRVWHFYVDDMITCAEKVLSYCAGLDQQAFVDNPLVYDATWRSSAKPRRMFPRKRARPTRRSPGACSSPRATG